MLRRMWMVVGFVGLAGCEGALCDLLGDFTGGFAGDLSGGLVIDIVQDAKGNVTVDLSLKPAEGDGLSGSSPLSCDDGELVLDLTDSNGETVGTVTGILREGTGSGDYTLRSGEAGTWEY